MTGRYPTRRIGYSVIFLLVAAGAAGSYLLANRTPPPATPAMVRLQPTVIVGRLEIDQPLRLSSPGGWVNLQYESAGEEIVTISARSLEELGVLDPVLEVLARDGTRLAYDDDGGENGNARIENLTLALPGLYTIRVNTFNGVSTGEVEITVTTSDPFAEMTTITDDGIVISASLPAHKRYTYRLTGEAGEVITLTVRGLSNGLDPFITLRDADGGRLALNDDHGTEDGTLGRLDAQIAGFALPVGGTYVIEVADLTGAAGRFELTIERG